MIAMRVRVLFFGQLKDIVGLDQDEAELSDGARVEDLFERYGRRFPRLAEFRPSIAASVNQEYAGWRESLSAGDEVAFLPPVSGGDHVASRAWLIKNDGAFVPHNSVNKTTLADVGRSGEHDMPRRREMQTDAGILKTRIRSEFSLTTMVECNLAAYREAIATRKLAQFA